MAAESSLVKTILHKSLAEGVYRDVVTRSSSYYYFLGKTLKWADEDNPPYPVDSLAYEHDVRNEMITIKEIRPSDVAFVVPRIDWVPDTVYDMYDTEYTDELVGINIVSGGSGYIDIYDIEVTITGGGGTGATAIVSEISSGAVAAVTLLTRGRGYTTEPTVTITSASGSGAELKATMGLSSNNFQKIEDCQFYVVTDEFNVYKCLDNNNGARSTYKPTTTTLEPIKTLDGYAWKFMYNIPINLRNKFVTGSHIPVVSALTSHFYSNGTIDNIFISNRGQNYTSAIINVTGDGYRESDPIYLDQIQIVSVGTAYKNPTISFGDPVVGASQFQPNSSVNIGQKLYNASSKDFYEVVTPGISSAVPPTHRVGTALNGSAAFKYIGTTVKGDVSITNPKNITKFTITNVGTGYTTAPTVDIVDSTGSGATAIATIGKSSISSITVTSGGSGYVAPQLSFIGGGGVGVTAIPTVVSGVITAVTVITNGYDYTTAPNIVISDAAGTGANLVAVLSGSPIQTIEVVDGGSNYSSITGNTVGTGTITSATNSKNITGSSTLFTTQVTVGQILKTAAGVTIGTVQTIVDNTHLTLYANAYVAGSGQSYKIWTGPTVTISGGGGAGAVATATVETGIISQIQLYGGVREVIIVSSGSGYIQAPEITFTGGGGLYAVAKSKLYADKVISSYMVNSGDNYTTAPTVTFGTLWQPLLTVYTNDQFANNTNLYTVVSNGVLGSSEPTHTSGTVISSPAWVANTNVALNTTVYVSNRLYKVISAGITSTTAPTHTSGNAANGTATLQYLGAPASLRRDGTPASGYATLRFGAGYAANPLITFTDETGTGAEAQFLTSKSEAKIVPIVADGQIVYIAIEDAGIGYTKATLQVTGDGEGASLVADLSLGSIGSQQANNEILTPAGTIDAIAIVSGGYSYGVANISIEGDGEGATATATIDPLTNAIVKINITNRGSGYSYANVKVTGNGNGASLRAIISPFGGHGKNCPEELFARSLMFYSNISNDLNQGVVVANDYRQAGIIKNPRVFDGNEIHQGTIGSACYVIQSPIDMADPMYTWIAGMTIEAKSYIWTNGRVYRVINPGVATNVAPTHTSGIANNGTASLQYVTNSTYQNIFNNFAKDDDLYIERTKTLGYHWEPTISVTLGDFLWYSDRIYTVVASGITSSIPPTSTVAPETNGSATLTYVGSTKAKKRYRVVSVSAENALVQSLDNDVPLINDIFIKTNETTNNFTVTSVGLPTVDKYSGQLMYIDNKQGFTPSSDETITLRTIIQF